MSRASEHVFLLGLGLPNFNQTNLVTVLPSSFHCRKKRKLKGTSIHETCISCQKWRNQTLSITCSAGNKPSSPEVSSTAKIRSEVLSPFRTVRMFFSLAFIASGALGGLIATTQLISALTNTSKAATVPEILKGLGIDLGTVSIFAFLYSRDLNAKNAQLERLSREENLSNLKLRVDPKKVISINDLRGIARLVIIAGPASFITESFRFSEPFTESLIDRGVLVVPFATDGGTPTFEFGESDGETSLVEKKKRLWQLAPVFTSEWAK